MHKLHTTSAFVLQKYPSGESSFTYKLLTRELGLVYAHAQGVRELKSRNRYALKTGQLSIVTLVKGREVWRITGAQCIEGDNDVALNKGFKRRILSLVGKLVALEDVSERLYDIIESGMLFVSEDSDENEIVEALTLFRLMDELGFVARPISENIIKKFLDDTKITKKILDTAKGHKRTLVARVNIALEEAK